MRGLKFRGRPPIRYADSVRGVVDLSNPYAATMMDRASEIDEDFVDAIAAQSVLSWSGRKPSPALDEDGVFVGTDLDLLSFLFPLSERGAVIEFPRYRSHGPTVVRANERRVSTPSRFGPLTGMTSNQKFFSFSVRMVDNSVIVTDPTDREKPGAYRNFMVVGPNGQWHPGWERIVFSPTAAENRFLTENDLWTGNTVYFKNAVHPNRWQSVFGSPYLLLKMLIERLSEEYSHYNRVATDLKKKFPLPDGEVSEGAPSEPSGAQMEKKTVPGIEAVLDLPDMRGEWPKVPQTKDGLLAAHRRAKLIRYTLKPKAQLVVRADELAYFLHGESRVASWMSGRSFKEYTPPRGRISWQQLVLSSDVSYRIRKTEFTDTVAVGFAA